MGNQDYSNTSSVALVPLKKDTGKNNSDSDVDILETTNRKSNKDLTLREIIIAVMKVLRAKLGAIELKIDTLYIAFFKKKKHDMWT